MRTVKLSFRRMKINMWAGVHLSKGAFECFDVSVKDKCCVQILVRQQVVFYTGFA